MTVECRAVKTEAGSLSLFSHAFWNLEKETVKKYCLV